MKKRDLVLLLVGCGIVLFLYLAPPISTPYVPKDEDHEKIYSTYAAEGKKAAGKLCIECHDTDTEEFKAKHKTISRCLFCHRTYK